MSCYCSILKSPALFRIFVFRAQNPPFAVHCPEAIRFSIWILVARWSVLLNWCGARAVQPETQDAICGVNDLAVLGALRAFSEVGRSNLCLALGVGAFPEARRECDLRKHG